MSNHYQIELEEHPIELYKLLKIANLVSGGGEAKMLIGNGHVLLNGDIETQKRKKIYSGDIIEFNNDLVELICHAKPIETLARKKNNINRTNNLNKTKNNNKNNTSTQQSNKNIQNSSNINNGQRRKIHFD